jgi:hypothetical protein
MQNVAVGQDSPVNVPVPVSTMAGELQIPLLRVNAWPEWSSATQVAALPQEIAISPPEGSVNALRQPAGGVEDSTAPLLSAAKHAEVLGQDTPVMTALPCSGCTGSGALQPGAPTGWAGVSDGAGEVAPAEPPLAEVRPLLAAAAAGLSGAVSLAA